MLTAMYCAWRYAQYQIHDMPQMYFFNQVFHIKLWRPCRVAPGAHPSSCSLRWQRMLCKPTDTPLLQRAVMSVAVAAVRAEREQTVITVTCRRPCVLVLYPLLRLAFLLLFSSQGSLRL